MSVVYPHINTIAILVAAAAQFVLSWLWYMPGMPTGRIWMAEMGQTEAPAPSPKLALYYIGAVLTAWVIAMTYAWAKGAGLSDGITIGVFLSVPIIAMEVAGGLAMNGRSMAYILVQSGYALIGYAIMGAIIAVMP